MFVKMIGFLMYHGLCYYYLKTGNTTNVLPKIEKISQYGSCVIYLILAVLLLNVGIYSILILCVAGFESIALCILPVIKTSAAFELIRIDAANRGWNIDDSGYIFTKSG